MVKVCFPSGGSEAKPLDRINSHLTKIAELGLVGSLNGQKDKIEVVCWKVFT